MKKNSKKNLNKGKLVKMKSKQPDFKPGDKPYTKFGNDVLNKDVAWHELVSELMRKKQSITSIATYADCSIQTMNDLLSQKFRGLNFRSGARLITLHYNLCRAG